MGYWEHQQDAGFKNYPERTTNRPFVPEKSQTITVASGQVLKARSFVKSNSAGKMIAGGNISEYAKLVLSGTLADTDTAIAGGITVTATGGIVTAAQVITALLTQADVGYAVVTGTLTGWTLVADPSSTTTLWAYATTGITNVTDFAVTGTNTSLTETVTTVAGSTTFQKPSGILAMDVDATSGDIVTTMYTEVYAYESEIIWGVDGAVDTITKADGTTVACSAYNTGAVTPLLRKMYVENTEFEIVTPTAGEELV
jgi:hypothetical protein